MTVSRDKKVAAVHDAVGGAQLATAGVAKGFAWSQQRLFTDDAQTLDLFGVAMGVFNDPVAGNQLSRHTSGVGNGHSVGKQKCTRLRRALIGEVPRFGLNAQGVIKVGHGGMVTATMDA